MSITQQPGTPSLADVLAPAAAVAPSALDTARAFRRIELTAIQGAFDAELARLTARRESHALLASSRRNGDALSRQKLFAEVDQVLAKFSDYLPELAAPAPRTPRD